MHIVTSSSPPPLHTHTHHTQVVVTEKERRDSELEHKRILEECSHVMEEYRAIEKKLRSHIVKSRSVRREGVVGWRSQSVRKIVSFSLPECAASCIYWLEELIPSQCCM